MVSGKRIYSDFKVFSRGYLRNKFGLFFGLVFPVILILIFGAIFAGGSTGKVNVYAQNQDTGPFATPQMDIVSNFLTALNDSSTITVITVELSLIHISEPTRRTPISYAVFCLKKKKK